MWFLSRYMCDFWFLVYFGWSDCLFNSARVTTFFSGKLNDNSGSDCLVSSAHVVDAVSRFFLRWFSGHSNGNSVYFTSSALTGSLFCSRHCLLG